MQWEAIWNTKKTIEAGNEPSEKFQRCPIINAHKAFLLASQVQDGWSTTRSNRQVFPIDVISLSASLAKSSWGQAIQKGHQNLAGMSDMRILVFSKHCNHCSNQSSNKKLNSPSLAHRCCTGGANPSKVCASAASNQDGPRWWTAEPPPALATKGLVTG